MAEPEPRKMATCATCGISYDVSARTDRDIRAGRVEPRCTLHRKRNPRPATVLASHRRYWLDRWSVAEIVEVGNMIWPATRRAPAPTTSPAVLALAASGQHVEQPLTSPPEEIAAARAARRAVARG